MDIPAPPRRSSKGALEKKELRPSLKKVDAESRFGSPRVVTPWPIGARGTKAGYAQQNLNVGGNILHFHTRRFRA